MAVPAETLTFLLLEETVTLLTLLLDYICVAALKQHKWEGQDRLHCAFPRQKRTATAFTFSNKCQSKVIETTPHT